MGDHKFQYPVTTLLSCKHTRVMEKLKAVLLMRITSDPDRHLSPSQIALIQHKLLLAFPEFHIPTHPTYSAMIESAIKKLNEEDGSNEESISKYIKENCDDLPWAHSIYLSYHLKELCKNGEIVCTCGKFYTTPASIQERSSRKKQRKRKLGRKTKGLVIKDEEGNSGDGNMVEVSTNLTGFQEEDSLMFEQSSARVKRRRRSLVVDDEDEDEEPVVGEDKNMKNSSKILVVPLQDGDDCSGKASGVSEEWGGIGAAVGEDEDRDHVYVPLDDVACEGKTEPELPLLPSSVGRLHAECEAECDDVGAEFDEKSSNIWVDALEPVVKESNGLQIVPFGAKTFVNAVNAGINNPSLESEGVDFTIICGLASPKLEQPKPKPKQQVYFTKKRLKGCNEKIKVSLESTQSFPALSVAVGNNLLEHNQMHELSETKPCTTLLDSPKLKVLSVGQSQQACTSSILEDGFVEQLERQNCLDPLHHPSSLEELMLVVDEENVPLQQVLEKYGKRKRHAVPMLTVKSCLATEASSILGSKLQVNQPESENSVRMMPIMVPEVTLTKSQEKQRRHLQRRRELKPQVQKHCNIDQGGLLQFEMTAETFSSIDEVHDWEDNQQTSGALDFPFVPKQSTQVNTVASALTKHLNGQKEELDLGEAVAFDTDLVTTAVMEECQSFDKGTKLPTKQSQGRPSKAMSTVDDLLEVSTPSQCHDGMEDEHGKSQCLVSHHDPETGAVSSKIRILPTMDQSSQHLINQSRWECQKRPFKQKDAQDEASTTSLLLQHQCHWLQGGPSELATNLVVEETYSRTCQIDKIKSHELETDGRILCPDVESGFVVTGYEASDNLLSEQERHKRQPITRLSLSEPSLHNSQHKIQNQGESQDDVRLQDLEATAATFAQENVRSAIQKSEPQFKQLKRELRRSQEQLKVNKEDVVPSSNELLQHQGVSGSATHWNRKQRGRPRKDGRGRPRKACRGRPRKEKGAVNGEAVDSMNLHPQLHGLSKQATGQHSQQQIEQQKKVGRQSPRKQMEVTRENAITLPNLHLLQQKGLSEPTTDHDSHTQIKERKKGGRGKPGKQIGAKDDKSALYLQSQEELSELAISQDSPQKVKLLEKKGQGRPCEQIEATKEDAEASSNLHMQLREGAYKPATDQHSQKQTKQVNKDGRGRPRKQLETANEDASASSVLHVHQEKVSSELATHQHSQQKSESLERKSRGRPRKQVEASKNDASASSNLHLQQQARSSEPATHRKKDGRGRPRKQEGTKKDDTVSTNLLLMEQERKSQGATYQYSQLQNKRCKREGQEGFLKQKEEAEEDPAGFMDLHLQEQTVLVELATYKGRKQFEMDDRGRPWIQQVHKEDPATPSSLSHQLEDKLSDQEKERKVDDCPDFEPEKSQNEVQKNLSNKMRRTRSIVASVLSDDESRDQHKQHVGPDAEPEKSHVEIQGTLETGQAIQPSEVDIYLLRKDKKLHGGSQQPNMTAMTIPLDIERDQQQEEQCCHEHEEKHGKFEGQAKLPKAKSAKITMIQVPLSSKNQLRSRIKRQSQDNA